MIDDLLVAVRQADGERVSVQWLPDVPPPAFLSRRVLESITHYKLWLPEFVEKSGANLAEIHEFRTEIFLKPNKQVAAEAHLVDDRGKEYVSKVKF